VFRVLPLRNPPHHPRYNRGMEESIRDFKIALALRLNHQTDVLALAAELAAADLNHQP